MRSKWEEGKLSFREKRKTADFIVKEVDLLSKLELNPGEAERKVIN